MKVKNIVYLNLKDFIQLTNTVHFKLNISKASSLS